MSDELTVCAAAFLRNKGKNIVTETEFLMGLSMDLHWMPHGDAKRLLSALLSNKILEKNGEYLKPTFEVSDIQVPVAYRPSSGLIASLNAPAPEKKAAPVTENLLPALIADAVDSGMEKRDFIAKANLIQKDLNIDILAAGLIVLRDRGVDIDPLADRIYDHLANN